MALWIGTSRIGGSWAERNPPLTWPAARYNGLDRGNFVTSPIRRVTTSLHCR